jgi:glycosyltransferase involved in cell wall biosynthesis
MIGDEDNFSSAANPLLSIIITCYNYDSYVSAAIDSVLDQNSDFIELIVVDDGSRDGSWEKICGYGGRLKAARIENSGAVKASLHGFGLSTGRFVYFLDADDEMKPGSLDVIRRHLTERVSKIQFALAPIDRAGMVIGPDFPKLNGRHSSEDLKKLIALKGTYLTPPTSGNVYRRDVYTELGDLSYERGIDGIAYLLAPFVGEVISLPRSLARYRIHDQSLSAFSSLSPGRVEWYAKRFSNRLRHLSELLAAKGIPYEIVHPDREFAYVIENEILALSLRGQRIPFRKLLEYARSVYAEEATPKRELFAGMYLLLALLPHRLANELVLFRINQTRYPWIRRILKTLTQI